MSPESAGRYEAQEVESSPESAVSLTISRADVPLIKRVLEREVDVIHKELRKITDDVENDPSPQVGHLIRQMRAVDRLSQSLYRLVP